jgi:hypothetical protein
MCGYANRSTFGNGTIEGDKSWLTSASVIEFGMFVVVVRPVGIIECDETTWYI